MASARRTGAPKPKRAARSRTAVRVLVASGPNLDRLGAREPAIYGSETLQQIHERLQALAAKRGAQVDCRQSNHEGALIDWIGAADDDGFHGIVLNPGALTHTSYALYDALRACPLPAVEVHLSNPDAREAFRRRSRVAPACAGRVAGFGGDSYLLGLQGLLSALSRKA
jgi:3-dehydroquinate dehydratase II